MRSIIDEIATAEERAEQIRQGAAVGARERISKAREEGEAALANLALEERAKTEAELKLAQKQGEQIAAQELATMAREADALCARAADRVDNAVTYLLDKVIQSA